MDIQVSHFPAAAAQLQLRVEAAADCADGVRIFDLRAEDGAPLPAFSAGAHIDLVLEDGLVRQYSLLNPQGDRDRYLIAVARGANSRGGSRFLHDRVRPGDRLTAIGPRSHFSLRQGATYSVLLAGGIGVTPLWSMVQRLQAERRPWRLHYAARTRARAALIDDLEAVAANECGGLETYFSREPGGQRMDIAEIVRSAPEGADFYCCGPAPMMDAFQAACAGVPRERVHMERFAPAEAPARGGGFTLVLRRSRRSIEVAPGQTILAALRASGVGAPYSCQEGVCGQCETVVLEGAPDHRDAVLTDDERATGRTMMICCSGSRSTRLVLDL